MTTSTAPGPAPVTASPNQEENLRHLPAPARAAFALYQTTGDAATLDPVLFAILEDFRRVRPAVSLASLPGSTRLIEDLGFDSMAITEVVFFTEDLFGLSISNAEIAAVRSLDDLRHFVRHKLSLRPAR